MAQHRFECRMPTWALVWLLIGSLGACCGTARVSKAPPGSHLVGDPDDGVAYLLLNPGPGAESAFVRWIDASHSKRLSREFANDENVLSLYLVPTDSSWKPTGRTTLLPSGESIAVHYVGSESFDPVFGGRHVVRHIFSIPVESASDIERTTSIVFHGSQADSTVHVPESGIRELLSFAN